MNPRFFYLVALLLVCASFASFDVFLKPFSSPNDYFTIHGNTSGTSDVNVSASIVENSSINISNLSVSGGSFTLFLRAPATEGDYNISITSNASLGSKIMPVYVSTLYNATISVLDSPTYQTGSSFLLNVSLLNSSGLPAINHAPPTIFVFQPMNGKDTTWTITNQSGVTDSLGSIVFNVTIPGNASGVYLFVVDKGSGFYGISVKAASDGVKFEILSNPTSQDASTQQFGAGENVTIKANLKYSNGTMITGASVTFSIALPNNSVTSISASETSSGVYQANFTSTSESGDYSISGSAVYGSITYKSNSLFTIGLFSVELVPNEDKFFKEAESGGKIAVKPNAEVSYIVLIQNLTTKKVLNGSLVSSEISSGAINCSNLFLASVVRANDSVSSSISDFNINTTRYFGTKMCLVNFSAPSVSANYKVTIGLNGTDNGSTSAIYGDGFFPVQSFILKVNPVSSVAGQETFHQMFSPGSNVTFVLTAINASGSELAGSNISNIEVVSLFNLPTGTLSQASELNYSVDNGADSIGLVLPTSLTDAFVLTVRATINQNGSSETAIGDTFFFSKYIVGFMVPLSGDPPAPGSEASFNFDASSKCVGNESFLGDVRLASTGEQISSVWLNTVPQLVMEESTGKLATHCITFQGNSSLNGTLLTYATFNSSCSLSGRYFFLANVTYSDNSGSHNDALPGSFQCVQLKGRAELSPERGGFSISSTGTINVSVNSVRYLNGSNVTSGTVEVTSLRAFEGFGPPRFIEPSDTISFSLTNGSSKFQLFTSNFSDTNKWTGGEGFIEADVRVCDSGSTCNTFTSGVPVGSSIDVWVLRPGSGSSSFVLGQNVSVNIYAKTNLTMNGTNLTVRFETFGTSGGISATSVSAAKISDSWDAEGDSGFEIWDVNATVPVSLPKGQARAIFTVTDLVGGERISRDIFGSVQGATIGMPDVGIPMFQIGSQGSESDPTFNTSLSAQGWNMSWIAHNFSFSSYSTLSRSCFAPNVSIQSFTPGSPPQIAIVNSTTKLLILDTDADSSLDTILLRDTSIPNNATNSSAFIIVNSTNRTMVNGLYLWQILDCGYVRALNTNISYNSLGGFMNLGEQPVNSLILSPFFVVRGDAPVSGVSVNITAIYKQRDEGFGLTEQLSTANYSVTSAVTDANGLAFVYLNISNSGKYRLFWKLNGTVNETATLSSTAEVTVRNFAGFGNILYNKSDGIVSMALTNSSAGSSLLCPGGSCQDIFNGSASNFLGLGALSVSFNRSNSAMVFNLAGTNGSCSEALSDYICLINTSNDSTRFTINNYRVSIAGASNTSNTNSFAFYVKEPSPGDFYSPSPTERLGLRICAQNVSLSSKNQREPINNLNITALFIREFSQSGPPSTTVLQMYNPLNGSLVSSAGLPVWVDGCTAFITNKSSGNWPSQGEIRANLTAMIGGSLVTEEIHVAQISR